MVFEERLYWRSTMETKANYTLVGAFVIALIAGLISFAIWISKVDFENDHLYDVFFENSVSGLRKGETVTYNGVPIGAVKDIGVDHKFINKIKVTVGIDKKHYWIIKENSFATIEPKGITGQVHIQIHGSTTESPILKAKSGEKYPVIKAVQSKFQEVIDEAPKVLHKLVHLIENITPVFNKENKENLSSILTSVKNFSKKLDEETKDLNGMFKDIRESFRELKGGSAELSETMRDFRKVVDDNRGSINDFTSTGLNEFTKTITEIRELAKKIEGGPLRNLTPQGSNTQDLG